MVNDKAYIHKFLRFAKIALKFVINTNVNSFMDMYSISGYLKIYMFDLCFLQVRETCTFCDILTMYGDLNIFLQPKGKASLFVYLPIRIRYHFTTHIIVSFDT